MPIIVLEILLRRSRYGILTNNRKPPVFHNWISWVLTLL